MVSYWKFPLDGSEPSKLPDDWEADLGEYNVARCEDWETFNPGLDTLVKCWRFSLEGSYEVLSLEVTARDVDDAALVYAHLLQIHGDYLP